MKQLSDLEEILFLIKGIDEENFDSKFPFITNKMITIRNELSELDKNELFTKNLELQKKIDEATKLISEEYDNLISLWRKKISDISEMLISSQNEKKVLSYKR